MWKGRPSTAVMGSVESLESDWVHLALSPIRQQNGGFFWRFGGKENAFLFSFLFFLRSLPLEEREALVQSVGKYSKVVPKPPTPKKKKFKKPLSKSSSSSSTVDSREKSRVKRFFRRSLFFFKLTTFAPWLIKAISNSNYSGLVDPKKKKKGLPFSFGLSDTFFSLLPFFSFLSKIR